MDARILHEEIFPIPPNSSAERGFQCCPQAICESANSLLNFVKQYRKIQQKVLMREGENEAVTTIKDPGYLTGHPMEDQMKEIYTRKLFNVFQDELQKSSRYYVVELVTHSVFDIVSYYSKGKDRAFKVTADKPHEVYNCTCCKFERDGILCRHILKVFDRLVVHYVPTR